MDEEKYQISSSNYAKAAAPCDEGKGWQIQDIRLAYISGSRASEGRRRITVKEVADRLSISSSMLRGLIKSGDLAYVKLGAGTQRTHVLICTDDIESLIKRNRRHSVGSMQPGVKTRNVSSRPPNNPGGFLAQRVERLRAKQNSKLLRSETAEIEAKK